MTSHPHATLPKPRANLNRRRALVPAAALLLLAGCATAPVSGDREGADFESHLPAHPPKLTEAPPQAQAQFEAGQSAASQAPDEDPERLIGLGTQGLYALLGEPKLIRREDPAQVWQYRGIACVFDVVLYRGDRGEQVTYIEARDDEGNKTASRACYNELLRARQLSTAS